MLDQIKASYRRQMGASFTAFEQSTGMCTDEVWHCRLNGCPFWQIAYHILFYADFYLSETQSGFRPTGFHVRDLHRFRAESDDGYPEMLEKAVSRIQITEYLAHCRDRTARYIDGIDESHFSTPSPFDWHGFPKIDLVPYNMRHTHHHISHLNVILRQNLGSAPEWVMHDSL